MIKWFRDINKNGLSIVGGKGLNLGKMYNYGFNVPNGFVVTSEAYHTYINKNGLRQKIDCILKQQILYGKICKV